MNDLTGQRFGRLTIIEKTERRNGAHIIWKAVCDCGKTSYPNSNNLLRGISQSCRCLQREKAKERLTKHGMCKTTEYEIWCGMIKRCTNENCLRYADYGGRGIKVCERWRHSFNAFYKDVGQRPEGKSIDRYPDYNGNYEPKNIRWATPHEQRINSRPKSYGPQKQRWFRAWHKDMMCQFMSNNQNKFARKWKLTNTHISRCLNSKAKSHKGWIFELINGVSA